MSDMTYTGAYEGLAMKKERTKKLSAQGWKVGSASEFLGLTNSEEAYIELKLALANGLRDYRSARALTQVETARLVGSSQSRVAKMESADPSVSLDLIVRSLLALGATPSFLARTISHSAIISEAPASYSTRSKPRRRHSGKPSASGI
jgi:hypothetical protein